MSTAKLSQLLQSGLAHHRAGRWADADLYYRQARTLAPRHFDAVELSGLLAYQQGKVDVAVDLLGRAARIDPNSAVAAMRLGLALLAVRRIPEGERELRRAVQRQPDFVEGWENLAYALKLQDRLGEAVACHQKVTALKPDYALGWYNFGLTLSVLGQIAEALACHDRAIALDPKCGLACFGRAQALHQSHRIPECVAAYDEFLRREPGHLEARSFRLYALHSLEDIAGPALFAEHAAYGRRVGPPVERAWANPPEPGRRLRVGILSPDLREHSCAYFLEPLLQHLDAGQFEVYLYHDHFREDAVSARLRAHAAQWRPVVSHGPVLLEATILADNLDVAIDLAGHTGMTNRLPLFARRVAPVQVTYLGYPNTTGVPAMDYRFTDEVADPAPAADALATEHLVRFSPCAWTFAPRADAPGPERRAGDAAPGVTFGCFNTPAKINEGTLRLWTRILEQVPDSRLLLKGAGFGQAGARARWSERLARAGLPPERVGFLERTSGSAEHLAHYAGIDLALDTFPYHGTTTTCEALWMGVPVIVLAGTEHRSRVGASLLAAVGRTAWLAADADDYVAKAVALAADAPQRAAWRREARTVLAGSVLLDHAGQAARFGAALRACWTAWCDQRRQAA